MYQLTWEDGLGDRHVMYPENLQDVNDYTFIIEEECGCEILSVYDIRSPLAKEVKEDAEAPHR